MNKPRPWWQNTTIYQVYPRSFYDSNGDGVGDLQGLIEKLPYLQNLGVETLWISPFFASPQQDFGYDISDYLNVDPAYGTLSTVERLIENCHNLGFRIVFDLVLNHTSHQHPWFLASQEDTKNAYADWYIWADKPNNWKSMTGGNAWHYHPKTTTILFGYFFTFSTRLELPKPRTAKSYF
jgi:glycosidase